MPILIAAAIIVLLSSTLIVLRINKREKKEEAENEIKDKQEAEIIDINDEPYWDCGDGETRVKVIHSKKL